MIFKANQINNIEQLSKAILDIKASYQISNYAIFFRGTHKLLRPSLGEVECSADNLENLENELLNLFLERSGLSPEINLLIKIIAREHNLKSSLMDWSNEFYTPLDFATKAYLKPYFEKTVLYILTVPLIEIQNINKANHIVDVDFPLMLNFTPNYTISTWQTRKFTQGGVFLWQPYNFIQEDLSNHLPKSWDLYKIEISKELSKEIRKSFLNKKINLQRSIMPNSNSNLKNYDKLDSICKRLNEKDKIEKIISKYHN